MSCIIISIIITSYYTDPTKPIDYHDIANVVTNTNTTNTNNNAYHNTDT